LILKEVSLVLIYRSSIFVFLESPTLYFKRTNFRGQKLREFRGFWSNPRKFVP